MKNLKKLSKETLKTISGGTTITPGNDFCMYYCNGVVICATCSDKFTCPDNSM
ncbi:bacteriocin-like protein [Chryseobacterium gossypii]|uniref:bacteriocin-like protein n=1 Tax=Chryseobacterium gossypii TaxID=3231602 RepID=UPI0035236CB7